MNPDRNVNSSRSLKVILPVRFLICNFLCVLFLSPFAQNPPTILRSSIPPDINEQYRANPRFYEVMSAFPNPNSYTRYKFDEVRDAARNDPAMMVILGDHYRIGRLTPADFKKALREYQRAASRGYAMANHRIAYMYADGLGLPKDKTKILEYLRLSADGGYMLAQYDYALIFLNGKFNEPRDFAKAYRYLDMASKQGHKLSTELLAMLAIHPGSVNAGVPYGLSTAIALYRKAGDTDGERAIRQNIASFGGLRYYLRAMPGFLEGVNHDTDPTLPDQGIMLIKQLQQHQNLLGDELIMNYNSEIAENILYRAYFDAQGNRTELLRFIILCLNQKNWLAPFSHRYIEAASRDFRLTVQFSDINSLNKFLKEFSSYPVIFSEQELTIVADRVFVSLFLKDVDKELKSAISSYLKKELWIIKNLSSRYIALFETDQFLQHQSILVQQPYSAIAYLDEVFSRYNIYRPSEADTLASGLVPGLRSHCLHPYLSDRMIKGIGTLKNINGPIPQILKGMNEAAMIYLTDINRYFNILEREPSVILFAGADIPEIQRIAKSVFKLMHETGSKRLDSLCSMLPKNPGSLLSQINECNIYHMLEMETGNNTDRLEKLNNDLWTSILGVSNISCSDPNGVVFSPQITERAIPFSGLCAKYDFHMLLIHYPTEMITEMGFTIVNRSLIPLSIQITLFDYLSEGLTTGNIPASEQSIPGQYFNSETILLGAGESSLISIKLPSGQVSKTLVPVFRVINHKRSVFAQKQA